MISVVFQERTWPVWVVIDLALWAVCGEFRAVRLQQKVRGWWGMCSRVWAVCQHVYLCVRTPAELLRTWFSLIAKDNLGNSHNIVVTRVDLRKKSKYARYSRLLGFHIYSPTKFRFKKPNQILKMQCWAGTELSLVTVSYTIDHSNYLEESV